MWDMKMKPKTVIYCGLFFVFATITISCTGDKQKSKQKNISSTDIEKGKALAIKYCQSCHLMPDPAWVDAKTWENGILPIMGPRLGIFEYKGKRYSYSRFDLTLGADFYPSRPLVTNEEWQQIIDYYTATSPDTLSAEQHRPHVIKNDLTLFTPVSPTLKYYTPATSFVKIDTSAIQQPFIISDATKNIIYRLDKNLNFSDSVKTKGPVVDIELQKQQWISCNIGILNPNNGKYGNAKRILIDQAGKLKKEESETLFDQLQRPVQITSADLNNDGKKDFIVCEFGFLTGALSWMENKGMNSFVRHVLRPLPGAIKAYVADYNHDGLPDIWVLFAQGEEGIFLYTNEGNGKFSEKEILRFPPINGSSYFEMDDFNKDGFPDILYTCGDNADYSPVLKPFHGVYIYQNDGHNQFTQKYFFPLNGCYKAIARDYDNDGDLDIAAISYFPDYQRQPEEGFVYFENKGNYDFLPSSTPAAQNGRWLTMDAGDFDHDGKIDLILGNFSVAPSFIKSKVDWKNSPPFILLKNTGKKN
jgi:hypothetical protein